ncbi:MAG: RNA polymerase factor sigma-54 [Phycisphaeraceae bacterium]|nr:RNA polymerase factor sigma-54 [Phycisphaeraceae bacterium]
MRFDTSQNMKLGQQMKLAPRMIQSMEILQMPLADLAERIEQELENNVALEVAEGSDESEVPGEEVEESRQTDIREGEEGFGRLEAFEEDHPDAAENAYAGGGERSWEHDGHAGSYSRGGLDAEGEAHLDAMANAPARSASLTEQLLGQWGLVEVTPRVHALGELLVEKLDDDGYLRVELERIASEAPESLKPVTAEELGKALAAVQLFLEPPGVGARNHRECLLLQLDALEEDEHWDDLDDKQGVLAAARLLVEEHLDDLMNNRLPRIAEKSGLTLEEISAAKAVLRRLSLAPARRLVSDAPAPIVPDAIVEYDPERDRYFAYLNDRRLPNLRINREYALMVRDKQVERKDREFIKTNLGNAQWLIDAVRQRKETLLRVITVVLDAQRDFFDQGVQALRPLPMTQVADQLGIHVATVSRAVAEKYLLTPRGVVPLRKFFTGGLQTDSGEDMSYEAVRAALSEIVEGEDKLQPLSDDALAEALKARGIEIARRTVAKYRGQLGIPSARLRKAFE